ncbi:MAG TPA: flagellar basal-body MS-ring/collar protein FliF [Sphingomonas sp.]|jgi:flagellar M-ring protein FliF|nr:flagellar basal-body MS-ring/collar protein FliF [Sphingomonas sp.]
MSESGWLGRPRRQYAIVALALACVVALLGSSYWYFLGTGYAVLGSDMRAADAAAVVAELDKRGTAYRLRDGGATILVPEDQADATRLALARADGANGGQTGFELFNKSDMGLTNFAQKINYQRALQGELVRTILLMADIESARVHLALPDRALFRDDRTPPSAAVTVAMRGGAVADPARVAGIQQLVSAAVTDLPPARVVVLDAQGRVISQAQATDAAAPDDRPAALEERSAVEHYYRARARAAIEARLPGLRYRVRVVGLPLADQNPLPSTEAPDRPIGPRTMPLRLTAITVDTLSPEERAQVQAAVTQALALDAARDTLSFETGPLETGSPGTGNAPAPMGPIAPPIAPMPTPAATDAPSSEGGSPWPWLAVAALVIAAFAWRRRAATSRLSDEEQDAFAQTLRRRMALSNEADHAAR